MTPRILIVEDEVSQARALQGHLELEGYPVGICQTGQEALALVRKPGIELILSDLRLPDMDGLELFRKLREALGDDSPTFAIMTAYGTVEGARKALRSGVYDFITKPVDPTELSVLVKNVLDHAKLRRENRELREAIGKVRLEERLIGGSRPFKEMLELAKAAAESEATILIRGESGTGKELVAELIHAASHRAKGPFVKVNCGAIPEALLEAELFGHEQGAFTDARKARKGRFEIANGGTIFLDEIAEMSAKLQVKLLRVLQERELERLGGQGQVVPLDIRLVTATNRDLESMIREGTFREDLYYRINVITIQIPPLRERRGDIELLANHFCARFNERNRKHFQGLAPEALERLRAHSWPGNVRELENVIERAVVLGRGDWIMPEHLPALEEGTGRLKLPTLTDRARPAASGPTGATALSEEELVHRLMDVGLTLDDVEARMIVQALERAGGNVSQAARMLGLTRRTLQYRIDKYGIPRAASLTT